MQSKKENMKHPKFRVWIVPLIACAVILAAVGVLVKGISNRVREGKGADRVHISSNYLEEDSGASYTVADWGDGFDILLFNYEREDIAMISEVDMTYKITAKHAAVSVKKQNGDEVTATEDGTYSFALETAAAYHVLHVMPYVDEGASEAISITVETTSPGKKTLTAEFRIRNYRMPDYTVADQNNGTVLITVNTNDYEDSMTVIWEPDRYSPDKTNTLMALWEDESHIGSFPVSRDTTYELLFFKKTDDLYTEQKGTATEITLD